MPTSNLVSRLETAGSTGCDLSPGDPLCASAAEEIKRLGREVTRLQTDLIGAKEFFASATGTIEKLTAQRNRLHNQLLEHAEVCGESAYPISDRLAGESPASFHARALLALAQTAQMSASARNTLVSIAKAISSPFETTAFRGLKSISYRPDLPLVDLVMTFDSMEAAQAARERVTALVMPPVEPTPNQDGQQTPAPSGHAGLGTTGQSPSAVRSSENGDGK